MIVGVAYVENSTLAVGVEAVHRLDQADRADLDEVVERLTAVGEPSGAVVDEREVQLHELLAALRRARPRSVAGSPSSVEQGAAHAPRVGLTRRPPTALFARSRTGRIGLIGASRRDAGAHGEGDPAQGPSRLVTPRWSVR